DMGQEEGPVTSANVGPLLAQTSSTWSAFVNAVSVTDGDGTTYSFPTHSPQPSTGPCWAPCKPTTYTPSSIIDRNGNGIGITSSSSGPVLSYTDTIGRTALNIPTFGANPDSV